MSAKFRVNGTVSLSRRGFVIVGDILEGEVKIGKSVNIRETDGSVRREAISGIEYVDNVSLTKSWIGLVISDKNDLKHEVLKALVLPEAMLTIED